MYTENLPDEWSHKSKTKSSTQLVSYRLPTYLTAQIDALAIVFPNKNRTEIVIDLLTAAITDLDQHLPTETIPAEGDKKAVVGGKRRQFRETSNGFYRMREEGWFEPLFLNIMDY